MHRPKYPQDIVSVWNCQNHDAHNKAKSCKSLSTHVVIKTPGSLKFLELNKCVLIENKLPTILKVMSRELFPRVFRRFFAKKNTCFHSFSPKMNAWIHKYSFADFFIFGENHWKWIHTFTILLMYSFSVISPKKENMSKAVNLCIHFWRFPLKINTLAKLRIGVFIFGDFPQKWKLEQSCKLVYSF